MPDHGPRHPLIDQFRNFVYLLVARRLRSRRNGSGCALRGCGVNEGESASSQAHSLREQAAAAQAEAARLTDEAAAWEAGAEGERRVAEALSVLTPASNVIALHDRLLRPGRSQANLDHIVVSPGGAYLIDAKNWAGNVTVYQGSLWRHKPDGQGGRSSECMNSQVDQVRRMAETMETLSSCVIDPVLCLTGRNAHAFGQDQLIRGVHVVAVDQIAHWLASEQRTQPDEAIPALAQKLGGLFPQGTGPWSSLTPAPHTGKQIKSSRASRSTPSWTRGGASPRRTPSSRRRKTEKPQVAKGCLGLLAMMAMVLFGGPLLIKAAPLIAATVTHLATSPSASPTALTRPGQPTTAQAGGPGSASEPPCHVLTESTISKALGVRVYPVATSLTDTCQWGLRLDDQSTVVASATTGWLPSLNALANQAKRAIYKDGMGSPDVSISVPQFAAVPGSKVPAARITQPMQISLGTYRLGQGGRKFSNDQARNLVTLWARQVATAMPQGPGADSIRFR
jgi:Nuclease-related domain